MMGFTVLRYCPQCMVNRVFRAYKGKIFKCDKCGYEKRV